MSLKTLAYIGMTIGSIVGGLIPMLWGASSLSISSLLFGSLGAIAGIYFGYKLGQ